ncbi:MAG: uncharacterized protein KVP18_002777 [Porospora cf. gigantea A]|uniref:uncharacterized protein n=2 Tax=Porospora cf. gigantea A TaxID=2853593 RepID=UPI003559BE53|nr:MAG: hypothetical protein KVP18_002777 [Porospora cf. gigantea A]
MCASRNHRMLFLYGGYGHQTLRLVSRCRPAYQTSNRAAGRSFMDLVTTATTIGFDDVVEVPIEGDEDADATSVVVLQSNPLSPQTEHLNDLWCYDTALGKWSCLSPPDPFSVLTSGPQHAEHLFSFVFDGVEYLLVLGGLQALPAAAGQGVASFSKEVWLYDLTILDWRKLPVEDRDDGPCSRGFYAACLYQTRRGVRLFMYGGLRRNGVDILDDFFFLDITGSLESGARSRWVKVGLHLPPRYWHAGVLRGHLWILYGGRNQKDHAVGSVTVIDVAALTGSFMHPEKRPKNIMQKWLSRFTKGSVPRLFAHRMELLPDMLSLIIVGGIRKGRGSADLLKLENGVRLEEIIKASTEAKDFPLFDVLELVLRFV